jgi:hypothetical protein
MNRQAFLYKFLQWKIYKLRFRIDCNYLREGKTQLFFNIATFITGIFWETFHSVLPLAEILTGNFLIAYVQPLLCLVPRRLFVKKQWCAYDEFSWSIVVGRDGEGADGKSALSQHAPFPTAPSRVACLPEYFKWKMEWVHLHFLL